MTGELDSAYTAEALSASWTDELPDVWHLRGYEGYWYLATPYSKYHLGLAEAHKAACKLTAVLLGNGIPVYSPIAHTHSVALYGRLDPLDHDIWLWADKPLMDAAHGLIVARFPGWLQSYGIGVEIEAFKKAGKPIRYIDPEDFL